MSRDLEGKTILITGANTGIGEETALALGARGAKLYLACRSLERTQPVLDEINRAGGEAEFIALDLGDLASVRRCAQDFLQLDVPLHVLINNAGLAATKGETTQGFELAFGVNHLGHYLLTELLLEKLEASAPSRVVIVASKAHYRVEALNLDLMTERTRTATGFPEYCESKLCNVLHARALAKRLEGRGVNVYSLHPGVVASDVWRNVPWFARSLVKLFMLSNEDGAKTTLHCATADGLESGGYYDECKARKVSRLARDEALAEDLMQRSAKWAASAEPDR